MAPDQNAEGRTLTSGDKTVIMVGLKAMADWKRLYIILAASYSVFNISSAKALACAPTAASSSPEECS